MKDIVVLDKYPVIFTKDKEWLTNWLGKNRPAKPGAVIILPEDAVLLIAEKHDA